MDQTRGWSNRSVLLRAALSMAAIFAMAVVMSVAIDSPAVVRGKSAPLPLDQPLSPQQQQAQDIALNDVRVQTLTAGHRAEVFGVRQVLANQFTPGSKTCATADCRQVEIYLFDADAAVIAIVDTDRGELLDVLYQPGVRPGISRAQAQRAMDIAINAPEVIEELGFRPRHVDMAPVLTDMPGTSCAADHYCVGPNFRVGERSLWAIVDLTLGEVAAVFWGEPMEEPATPPVPSTPDGCPAPGNVERDGWQLSYATTGTDGLRVFDVRYNGDEVLTSVKTVQWHVDYQQQFGFRDEPGCSGGGGGYWIPPMGETQVVTMTNNLGTSIGFEIIQDFRMSNWGMACNYRYENRLQFFDDGRFRIANAAYGRGCQPDGIYRPLVRIDVAVDGDDGDTFAYLDDTGWHDVLTETYRTPYADPGHGPHVANAAGSSWSVFDEGGRGYFVVADQGQYAQSRGAHPYLYVTAHRSNEGDTDLGAIGNCCSQDHTRQGPDMYVNDEPVGNANIVLWYVAQMQTDDGGSASEPYCWTVNGEPQPETYPCITGPLFQPFSPDYSYYLPLTPSSAE